MPNRRVTTRWAFEARSIEICQCSAGVREHAKVREDDTSPCTPSRQKGDDPEITRVLFTTAHQCVESYCEDGTPDCRPAQTPNSMTLARTFNVGPKRSPHWLCPSLDHQRLVPDPFSPKLLETRSNITTSAELRMIISHGPALNVERSNSP